jgi:hypothetical protein
LRIAALVVEAVFYNAFSEVIPFQMSKTTSKESSVWEKVNSISSVCLVLVGLGAMWFAYTQIKESRDEAKIQHLVEVVQQFDQPPYSDIRRRLAAQRIDTKQKIVRPLDVEDPPGEMIDLLDFCQHIGLLVNRGYLDEGDVYGEFADPMFLLYRDARPLIDARRKEEPAVWGDFVDLVQALERIDIESNNGAANHPSQEEIYEEYNADAQVPVGGGLFPEKKSRPPKKK